MQHEILAVRETAENIYGAPNKINLALLELCGIMEITVDGVNKQTDIYSFLNGNKYHYTVTTWFGDVYASNDDAVLVTTGKGRNSLLHITVTKSGHATNRGIEVGKTLSDLIAAYGQVYHIDVFYKNRLDGENRGFYYPIKNKNYTGYDVVCYQEPISSLLHGESADGINFVIHRKTKNSDDSLLQQYAQANRHRAIFVRGIFLAPSSKVIITSY